MQKVCGIPCSLAYAKTASEASRKRAENKAHPEAREMVKTRAEHAREAQTVFNQYIRKRDAHLGCVSCDKPETWQGQWHASHYKSVGSSPALRFDPLNVHKSCSVCNNHLSGNIAGYRPELIRRIGLEAVEWLEGKHEPKRYTIDDLKAIKAEYRQKLRELDSQRLP